MKRTWQNLLLIFASGFAGSLLYQLVIKPANAHVQYIIYAALLFIVVLTAIFEKPRKKK
jgi:uncharacterized membrane protein